MLPRVVYQVTVIGVVNIASLGDGGGEAEAVWEPPEEEVLDTAAAQPDTATVPPDTALAEPPDSIPPDTATVPPDTTVVEPPDSIPLDTTVVESPDSIPPDTTVVEPPDSIPPDTTVAAPRRTDAGSSTLSRLFRLRRRLPLPPRRR